MDEKKKVFEEYGTLKALMVMAIPAIISQLVTLIYNVADTWFIGLTNNPTMVAACSLVLPIYMLSVVIYNLFGTGGGAYNYSAGNKKRMQEIFNCARIVGLAIAVLCERLNFDFFIKMSYNHL